MLVRKNLALIFSITIWSIFSFYFKYYFIFFHQTIGTIRSDILVFYKYYSFYIFNNYFFYPIEYPVGYVIIQKIIGFIDRYILRSYSYNAFLLAHALLMIPTILGIFILVRALAKHLRISSKIPLIYLFISPTFFFAASHNYDIFAVFFLLLSVYLLLKKRVYLSFIFLSLGTIIKLFSIFLLPVYIFYLLSNRLSVLRISKAFLIFLATTILVNLPFMLVSFYYWTYPFIWQLNNPQKRDPNTISFLLQTLGLGEFRVTFFIVFVLIGWLLTFLLYKKKLLTPKNFILCLYLTIFTTVFMHQLNTPQYFIWFLPLALIMGTPNWIFLLLFDFVNSFIFYFLHSFQNQQFFYILLIIYCFIISFYTITYIILVVHIISINKIQGYLTNKILTFLGINKR